jgi:hypothetical protein
MRLLITTDSLGFGVNQGNHSAVNAIPSRQIAPLSSPRIASG